MFSDFTPRFVIYILKGVQEIHVNYFGSECKLQPTIYSQLFVLTGRLINILPGKRWKIFRFMVTLHPDFCF